jgi:hypothetical protein
MKVLVWPHLPDLGLDTSEPNFQLQKVKLEVQFICIWRICERFDGQKFTRIT